MSWKESCAPLDQVPGLIVRGDGSGLIGGRGYVDHGDGTFVTWEDPFVIWQEPDGRYVAKMGLPRYGQVGKESPPGTIDEVVAFVVKEYEANPMKPNPVGFRIDCKRLYVPGTVLSDTCPKCNTENNMDLGDQYLSYPKANEPTGLGFYCSKCSHEWTREVLVTLKVELLPEVPFRERETLPD